MRSTILMPYDEYKIRGTIALNIRDILERHGIAEWDQLQGVAPERAPAEEIIAELKARNAPLWARLPDDARTKVRGMLAEGDEG